VAPPESLSRVRVSLALGALGALAFLPALGNAPIGDTETLLARVATSSGWSFFAESYWGDASLGDGLYRPLALLWIAGTHALVGGSHAAQLALGLALHVAGIVALHRLLLRLLPAAIATGSALIAAVHPIAAEAVITVYGQADSLAAVLVVASLWLHVATVTGRNAARVAGPAALALAALLVKESAVIGPLLAWLIDAMQRRRWRPRGGTLAMGAVVAGGVALRFFALGAGALPGAIAVAGATTFGAHIQLVIISFGTALRLLTLPLGQTIYYGHLRDAVQSGAGVEWAWVIGFVAACGLLRERFARGAASFGVAWMVIALLPALSLIPLGFLAAERALYLPRDGWAIAVVAIAVRVLPRRAAFAAATLAAVTGVALSWNVARQWSTPVSLWRHTVESHQRSPKAHAALALALLDDALRAGPIPATDPRLDQMQALARRSLELNPGSDEGLYALGVVTDIRGRHEEARQLLDAAAKSNPRLVWPPGPPAPEDEPSHFDRAPLDP
jgi:protein O-mannosyl-transferase